MSTEAEIEAAVTVAIESDALTPTSDGSDVSTIHADDYEYLMTTVLAAVEPLIRERLAQEVEAEALEAVKRSKHYEREGMVTSASIARIKDEFLRDAARIVRGDAS